LDKVDRTSAKSDRSSAAKNWRRSSTHISAALRLKKRCSCSQPTSQGATVTFELSEIGDVSERSESRWMKERSARKNRRSDGPITYLVNEIERKRSVLPPPVGGRKFHAYCSPRNAGAKELMEEVAAVRNINVRVTTNYKQMATAEYFVVYLTSKTWTSGRESAIFGIEVEAAIHLKMHLLLCHEELGHDSEARHACPFERFFVCESGETPRRLVSAGIYRKIAVPLQGAYLRATSLALVAEVLSALTVSWAQQLLARIRKAFTRRVASAVGENLHEGDESTDYVDTDPLGLADPFGLGRRDSIATAQGHEALLRVTEALNGGQCCRTSETDLPARSSWRRGSCSSQTHRYSSTSIGSRVSSATQPGEQTRAFRIASRARARARWGATQPKLREASSIMRGLKLPPPVGLAVEAYRMQPLVPLQSVQAQSVVVPMRPVVVRQLSAWLLQHSERPRSSDRPPGTPMSEHEAALVVQHVWGRRHRALARKLQELNHADQEQRNAEQEPRPTAALPAVEQAEVESAVPIAAAAAAAEEERPSTLASLQGWMSKQLSSSFLQQQQQAEDKEDATTDLWI